MKMTRGKKMIVLLGAVVLLVVVAFVAQRQVKQQPLSAFGRYQGYAEAIYDGTQRTSDYLTLSDGTRLAYDLILPTKNGVAAAHPLPVLFKYTPYGRAWTIYDKNGKNNLAELVPLSWRDAAMVRVRYWLKGNVMDAVSKTDKEGYNVEQTLCTTSI